jgi:hypothetical protein
MFCIVKRVAPTYGVLAWGSALPMIFPKRSFLNSVGIIGKPKTDIGHRQYGARKRVRKDREAAGCIAILVVRATYAVSDQLPPSLNKRRLHLLPSDASYYANKPR